MTESTNVNNSSVKHTASDKISVGDAFECEVDNEIIVFNAATDSPEI